MFITTIAEISNDGIDGGSQFFFLSDDFINFCIEFVNVNLFPCIFWFHIGADVSAAFVIVVSFSSVMVISHSFLSIINTHIINHINSTNA